jgi:hypothetical protein
MDWIELLEHIEGYISFNNLAATGTLISSIIAIFTLLALKKQTKSSYKPDIYLDFKTGNKVNYSKNEDTIRFLVHHSDEEFETIGILYSIENIGFGTAKDVEIKWDFNLKKILKLIDNSTPKGYHYEEYQHSIAIKNNDGENVISTMLDTYDSTCYDFILPRKDEVFNKSPHLPHEIANLFVVYFLNKHSLYDIKDIPIIIHEDFEEFPQLKATVTYKDIGGNTYKKKFKASMSISINNDELYLIAQKDDGNYSFNSYPDFKEL